MADLAEPAGLPQRLVICDVDPAFCEAASRCFAGQQGVVVANGRLEQARGVDCLVWPGNCLGLPRSGLDRALSHFFGASVLEQVQAWIGSEFGEDGCPIGAALLVDLESVRSAAESPRCVVFVAVFPRCRDGPELAMQGAMQAIAQHNAHVADAASGGARSKLGGARLTDGGRPGAEIRSAVCPGLGTFTGCQHAEEVAEQMAAMCRGLGRNAGCGAAGGGGSGAGSAGSACAAGSAAVEA